MTSKVTEESKSLLSEAIIDRRPVQEWVTGPPALGNPSKEVQVSGASRAVRVNGCRAVKQELRKPPVEPGSISARACTMVLFNNSITFKMSQGSEEDGPVKESAETK